MKKTLLFFGLMATMMAATGQQVSLKEGTSSQLGLKKTVPGYTQCFGMDESNLYVRYATGSAMNVGKVCFGRFNKLLEQEAVAEFDASEATPLVIFVGEKDVAMLLRRQTGRQLTLAAQHYDKQALAPVGEQQVLRALDLAKGHLAHVEAATSPNHQRAATLCLQQLPDSTVTAQVSLFDRQLNQLWHMEAPFVGSDNATWNVGTGQLFGAYSSFYVGEDGRVLVASTQVGGDSSTLVSLLYMDGKEKHNHTIATRTFGIRSAKVLKCDGSRVFITGNIEKVFARSIFQPSLYTRELYLLVYNLQSKKVESLDRYALTEDDCRVLRNLSANAATNREAYATNFCGAAIDADGITATFASKGILVMRADNNGKIQWVKTIRHDNDASWDMANMIQVYTHGYGDKVLLALNRDQGNVGRDPAKPAVTLIPGKSNAVLSLFLIDRQGNIEETNVELPKHSGMLDRPLLIAQDRSVFVGASGKGCFWGEIR